MDMIALEFDGDFLESIRYFEPESQRSIEAIENVTLAAQINSENSAGNATSIFDYLNNPYILASVYELSNIGNVLIDPFAESSARIRPPKFKETELKDDEEEFPEISSWETKIVSTEKSYENFDFKSITDVNWILEEEIGSNNRVELGFTEPPSINGNY